MELIRKRLLEKRAQLTKSEVVTAAWLEMNMERLAFLTVSEVAREARVSEATVVRFSRKLDFDSYTEMQKVAQESLRRRFFLEDRLRSAARQNEGAPTAAYHRDLRNLQTTFDHLNMSAFNSSVAAIIAARRVFVLGLRASSAVSLYMAFTLGLLRPSVDMVENSWDNLLERLIDMEPADVLIAVSRGRSARRTVEAASEARNRYGATVVALTDSSISPLAQVAQHVLVASGEEGFISYTSAFSLAGALVEGVAGELSSAAQERLRRIDELNDSSYSWPGATERG